MDAAAALAHAQRHVPAFLDDLRAIVDIDSGTYHPNGVARVAEYLQPRFEELGFQVKLLPGKEMGPQLVTGRPGEGQGRVLLVGHMDTVFPPGEPERRPFRIEDGQAYGPGVFDMKSGLLVGLYALRTLLAAGEAPWGELTFICNSDEEIGSPESHDLIAGAARQVDAALVLEPTHDVARVTTARKGVATYILEIEGVSAHAGVEPAKGRSAIVELAHKVLALHALNGAFDGVTVNVGVARGGERPNVVPDWAYAEIDLRAPDEEAARQIEAAIHEVAARRFVDGTTTRLTGGFQHQPFSRSERGMRLFAIAAAAAADLGITLRGEPTGGGSDGNTTAGVGTPTLDGLGLQGGLAHNPGEFVVVDSIAPRIALLAGLLSRLNGASLG